MISQVSSNSAGTPGELEERKMNKKRTIAILGLGLLLVLAVGTPQIYAANASVTATVTPGTSDQSIIPSSPSPSSNEVFYAYTVNANSTFTDSIPVQICTVAVPGTFQNNPISGYNLTLEFAPTGSGTGGNLPGFSLPTIPVFLADGCQTVDITLDLSNLAVGDYVQNFHVGVSESAAHTNVRLEGKTGFHLRVHAVEAPTTVSCFITDSDFNFLLDCQNNPLTSGSGGKFTIVTNKKNMEVATNPGQFYYNLVWTNSTGSDQTVSVAFARTGVKSHGTQAIHAGLFPPVFSGTTLDNFNAVNDGIPSGADDALESITVPDGWTLWVDYHLEWGGLGSPAPIDIATTCATANQCFSVTGTLSGGAGVGTSVCTAGACGYKK